MSKQNLRCRTLGFVALLISFSSGLWAQSDYGFYTKYGIGGLDSYSKSMRVVLNDYAGLRPGSIMDAKQASSMLGWYFGVGYTHDVGIGLWTEAAYSTNRSLALYTYSPVPGDSTFKTFSYIDHSFGIQIGANVYNDGFVRVGLFAAPSLNILKLQTVSRAMDPASGAQLFFRAAVLSDGILSKIDKATYWTLPVGITGQIGEGWGITLSAYYAITLGEKSLLDMRNTLNPDKPTPLFPEENYSSKMGGLGFTFCVFFGE